jgi:PKD repeat protein
MRSRFLLYAVIGTLAVAGALGHLGDRALSPAIGVAPVHESAGGPSAPVPATTVNASAKPTPADVGSSLNFYGIFTGFTLPYTLNWSFGDGTYSSAQFPVHLYSEPANYTVIFTVSGACCPTNNATIHVLINPALQSGASFLPTNPTTASVVNFTATPSLGTPPYVGFWVFGDGSTATGISVLHTYHSAGTYTVHVWTNDSGEGTSPHTLTVVVTGSSSGAVQPTGGTYILIGTTVAAVAAALIGFSYFQWEKRRRPRLPTSSPPPPS